MKKAEFEKLAEKVHKVYCEQYLKDNGKPYWTEGDYSKLDEKTKQYDRNIVELMISYAKEYAKQATKELREAITLKHAPDIKQREYIHSPAEEISIILDKYEASCPLERQEIIDEINARFIDIMNNSLI